MAQAYNKFEGYVGYLTTAATNAHTATYKVYLTNNAPSASADDVKADLAGITEENNYAAADITNTCTETSGTATCACVDVTWTATGGPLAEARYVVVYDDTHASDILVCWWDYGSAFTVLENETFTVDFTNLFTLA
jgi:hypothetical protein